jgi:replication-associated recombination protein RarA
MALKIIFSNNVDIGLPDHLVERSCRSVLERLRRNPKDAQTHRTGQRLVWDEFHRLLQTEYDILLDLVEFQDVA